MRTAATVGPTPEELAAIVAAVELVWPRPAAPTPEPPAPVSPAWRFSGRWWRDCSPYSRRSELRSNAGGSGLRTASATNSR